MGLKTKPFDEANHLHTEADRTRYLATCIEEASDDPAFIAHAIGVVARSRNMSELSRQTGVTREGLYKALSENGNPSFATVWKVMQALGYQWKFVRAPSKPARVTAKRAPRAATKSAKKKTK